jgi:ABC-2 type transport system ATP-binding protein
VSARRSEDVVVDNGGERELILDGQPGARRRGERLLDVLENARACAVRIVLAEVLDDPRVALEDRAGPARQLRHPLAPAVGQLDILDDDLGHDRVVEQRDQLVLGTDVVVQRHGAGAQVACDPAHRDRLEPFRVGDLHRGADHVLATPRRTSLAWRGARPNPAGKRFGELWALRELELDVPAGTVLGLLGHNGAGKTTAVRILTTLALPTTGTARVGGLDVVTEAAAVRTPHRARGAGPRPSTRCSARVNLRLVGRLYHLNRGLARRRADELLERLGLAGDADRLVKTFSGGMRRRLDLAATLVAAPPVLFLDEPTTGLDPASRRELWELLGELVRDGTTLLLTTQYLEEADQLAEDIVVLDHGRIATSGSPAELKARVGGERIDVTFAAAGDVARDAARLARFADAPPADDQERLAVTVPVRAGTPLLEVVRALDVEGVSVRERIRTSDLRFRSELSGF